MSLRRCLPSRHGFTVVELMVATLVMTLVIGAIFAIAIPAQATFHAQGEVADLHQRLRTAVDVLAADLRASGAVRPYRVGSVRDDAALGVFYRADTISALDVPSAPLSVDAVATRTYYLKSDPASSTFELMQYDGRVTDLPLIEHVVTLSFEYLTDGPAGSGMVLLAPAVLSDGPWSEDALHRRFDVDLLRVRQVRAHLRLESTAPSMRGRAPVLFMWRGVSSAAERFVPDAEIEVHVALRNTAPGPAPD